MRPGDINPDVELELLACGVNQEQIDAHLNHECSLDVCVYCAVEVGLTRDECTDHPPYEDGPSVLGHPYRCVVCNFDLTSEDD